MNKLALLTQTQLEHGLEAVRPYTNQGQLPTYIPQLAATHPQWLAVQVQTIAQTKLTAGDWLQSFCLMSVIKPFLLLYLLEHVGMAAVWQQVGRLPSDQHFNSIEQLIQDQGWPRNPFINSGAIALAAHLPGTAGGQRCDRLRQWLNQQAGCQLTLDSQMLASVRSLPNPTNTQLAELLAEFGYLATTPAIALDTYNHLCCLSGTVQDLSQLGLLLAQDQGSIQSPHRAAVNALMLTCGLYQASSEFAVNLGLPTKSGVSGALLAVVPRAGAIAIYSPTLDPAGNSLAGLKLLAHLAQMLKLSIFL